MKKIFMGIVAWFEQLGKARAASELARAGYYKEAKELMLSK